MKRDKQRDVRKEAILKEFANGDKLYTNLVAKRVNLTWPVADRLLRELVNEGRLYGDKRGYTIDEPQRPSLFGRFRELLHV